SDAVAYNSGEMITPRSVARFARAVAASAGMFGLAVACTGHGAVAPLVAACRPATPASSPSRPNIVFVLTDDLSTNLVRYMPHVPALARAGPTCAPCSAAASLCSPPRSSIFSGRLPHNTGVFTNAGPDGGFDTF